jgi:tRNA splicing ligase
MGNREKDTFVVLTHNYIPQKKDRSKWEVHEVCNIVDSVKSSLTISATCIINITKKTVVKNRAGGHSDDDYHSLVDYLVKTYPDQFKAIGYDDTIGNTQE